MALTTRMAVSGAAVAAAGVLGVVLSGCSVSFQTSKPEISATDLQSDLTDRLNKANNPAKSVNCTEDLKGEVGATARCDVVFSDTNSVEAVFTATKVEGQTVSYDIAPELTQEQLEKAVSGLAKAQSASCDAGLAGKVGDSTQCTVTADGDQSLRIIEVGNVDGLSMDLSVMQVVPKDQLADLLLQRITLDSGIQPDSVECMAGLPAKPGSTADCTAVTDGVSQPFVVTVTTVEGDTVNFEYKAQS